MSILIPPKNGLIRLANELNLTSRVIGSDNNDINVHEGTIGRVISSPYLSGSTYDSSISNTNQWFLVEENVRIDEIGTGLVQINFVPTTTRTAWDETRDSYVYKIKQEKSYGFAEWRNILGSKGDGQSYSN